MMLPLLNGLIFLMRQYTNGRVSTRKSTRAATTGIQIESKKREKIRN